MRTAKTWVARVSNWRFPGGWGGRRDSAPGQLTLHCELSDAGAGSEGRAVDVIIPADHLWDLWRMVTQAMAEYETARNAAARVVVSELPTGADHD